MLHFIRNELVSPELFEGIFLHDSTVSVNQVEGYWTKVVVPRKEDSGSWAYHLTRQGRRSLVRRGKQLYLYFP